MFCTFGGRDRSGGLRGRTRAPAALGVLQAREPVARCVGLQGCLRGPGVPPPPAEPRPFPGSRCLSPRPARGPPPDFGAGEFAADLLQEERAGASLHSRPLPGESCSLAELTQISRAVPLWGGFDTTVEPGQRRSRARQRVAKGAVPRRDPGGHWPAPAELAGSRVAARLGTRWSPWKVGLLLFTVCSKH